MRVTNNYMTRNYLSNLNRVLDMYNQSGNKMNSGRKFTKMSENVSDGTRALSIRTQSYKNEQIQENVKKAGETLSVAESNLTSIMEIVDNIHNETIKALNGTNDSASTIFETDFNAIKEQIVEFANCQYNNAYVLGGTNTQSIPFEVKNGELTFNGINVNDIQKNSDGKYYVGDTEVPFSNSIYIDIGINMTVKNGAVDPRTAFNMSVSGLECLGYGTSEITYQDNDGNTHTIEAPNNVYELIDEMAKCLNEKDYEKLAGLNDHLSRAFDKLNTEISDIGVRTNYLERHTSRLEAESDVLAEIQTNLEFIKDTDELLNNKTLEFQWLLTLQYGSKVLPQSLMDYIK